MKTLLLYLTIVAATVTACGTNESKNADIKNDTAAANSQTNAAQEAKSASADEMLTHYLHVKNALANDDDKEAASAAKQITQTIENADEAAFNAEQKKVYDEVKEDIKEHAEHISSNAGKIEHQREHFELMSKDMYDLVKIFKPAQNLYVDHCPMYNDNKGATWLSEVKEIKNPYLGKKMPDCGTVKEELKQ